jgi:hypothetical protein
VTAEPVVTIAALPPGSERVAQGETVYGVRLAFAAWGESIICCNDLILMIFS